MILRRLANAIRQQDWFVVTIEILIVVLGVFLGIEAANWNAERAFRAQEATYLNQLRAEILVNDEVIEHQIRYVGRVVDGGRNALAFLQGGDDCVRDCETLMIDFFHASQVWGTSYSGAKYREMERLGLPTNETTRQAVQDFYLFIDGWDSVNTTPPVYRERVRGHFTPEVSEALWQGCYKLDGGQLESLPMDCVETLKTLDVNVMLRDIHADQTLADHLRFWMGQNILALHAYPEMRAHAAAAVAAIDGVLESGE